MPEFKHEILRDIRRMEIDTPRRTAGDAEIAATAARSTEDEAGGMIELVAANVSRFMPQRATSRGPSLPWSTRGEIQVDVGVALYQAFELASLGDDAFRANEDFGDPSESSSSRGAPPDTSLEPASANDDTTARPSLPTAVLSTAVLVVGYLVQARTTGERMPGSIVVKQ